MLVRATRLDDIQFRFRRAPWLIAGKEPRAVIRENIGLTSTAMKSRLGIDPVGFRTPGGGYPSTLMGTMAHLRQTLFDAQYHTRMVKEHSVNPNTKRRFG